MVSEQSFTHVLKSLPESGRQASRAANLRRKPRGSGAKKPRALQSVPQWWGRTAARARDSAPEWLFGLLRVAARGAAPDDPGSYRL